MIALTMAFIFEISLLVTFKKRSTTWRPLPYMIAMPTAKWRCWPSSGGLSGSSILRVLVISDFSDMGWIWSMACCRTVLLGKAWTLWKWCAPLENSSLISTIVWTNKYFLNILVLQRISFQKGSLQLFIEKTSPNRSLRVLTAEHMADSMRTHGLGVLNTSVNVTYQVKDEIDS